MKEIIPSDLWNVLSSKFQNLVPAKYRKWLIPALALVLILILILFVSILNFFFDNNIIILVCCVWYSQTKETRRDSESHLIIT